MLCPPLNASSVVKNTPLASLPAVPSCCFFVLVLSPPWRTVLVLVIEKETWLSRWKFEHEHEYEHEYEHDVAAVPARLQ